MPERGSLASLTVSCLLVGAIVAAGGGASLAAEKIGTISQPLVAGSEVSAQEQQDQALVRPGGCSAAMLNSEWAITAVHCFVGKSAADITVSTGWPTPQTLKVIQLERLAKDIALLRLEKPLDALDPGYNMPVYTGDIAPGRAVRVYGQGIFKLATGKGASAQPSQGDNKWRMADFTVAHVDADRFWFSPNPGGAIPAGGDSGGPAFISAGNRWFLAGISSLCMKFSVEGKPQDTWMWVNRVVECGYAPVGDVWADIQQRIGTPGCRTYAWRAVGALQMTKFYNCDPKVVSGPRWSPNFDDHLNWCMHAKAADANAEDSARTTIMHQCRIVAAMPQGTGALTVATTGDGFALSGGGYPVNSRIIIRVFGPAAKQQNITSNFSDPQGNFAATLASAQVCAQAGTITFTAEDQDRPASPPVNATCQPAQTAEAPPGDQGATPQPGGAGQGGALPKLKLLPRPKAAVTVALAVDLYAAPGGEGQPSGMLPAGTPDVTLIAPCADNWCHVRWPTGDGWVYSGPDYPSLKLP
jgi:hypothetical protein